MRILHAEPDTVCAGYHAALNGEAGKSNKYIENWIKKWSELLDNWLILAENNKGRQKALWQRGRRDINKI